jgi:hypothetical protein
MDGLIREIIEVLERCSKPESSFSDEERTDNENLIDRVMKLYLTVKESEEEDHKALLLLFHKRLATPDNLDALLRMFKLGNQMLRV